jgi:hydrophobe/amphiphile efflux-3 (HAE3) family protein
MGRLARFSLAHPALVLGFVGAISALLALGLPRLRTEFGYRVLVGDDHPAMRMLDEFIETFGGAVPAQIVWECGDGLPCQSALDEDSLLRAHAITERLRVLPFVKEVTGISDAPLLVPSPEGFAVRHFVEDGKVAPDRERLAERARGDPLWVGTLISNDGRVGSVVVQPVNNESSTELRLVAALEEIEQSYAEQGLGLALVGDSVAGVISGRNLAESTARIIPITVAVIALVVFFLTRSWQFTAVSLGTMGVALLWTFGLLGWLDWPQDGILEVLAPLLLTIGVCDAVHLLSRHSAEMDGEESSRSGLAASEAMIRASRDVAPACLLTTLTTAGAFLSFATSRLETFVRFGTISAIGVMACLVLTFTLLPVVAVRLPGSGRPARRVSSTWDSGLTALLKTTHRRAVPIVLVSALLLLVFGIAWATSLRIDSNFFEIFGEQTRVMRWVRFVESRLRASDSLEVEIVLDPSTPIEDPSTLAAIGNYASFLSSLENLDRSTSLVDLVARVNRMLHEDDPAFERPAETLAGNAEILELLSFDGSDALGDWLSLDRQRTRISVHGPEQAYSSRERILREAQRYAEEHLPPTWDVEFTGEVAINVDWIKDVQGTQLRSFPTAFILVFLLILVYLRSVPLALAAMMPTLLPVVVSVGAMGWMGMSLDIGRAMIAAVVIGIGVDDAIHLLNRYKVHRAGGDPPQEAMRKAVLHVGRAVVTTSLALALGFLTLMASAWQTISSFGFFVALAILGALAATLFVLPALIFAFAGGRDDEPTSDTGSMGERRAGRTFVALFALLPVAGALGGSLWLALERGRATEAACWVLPNARVMPVPGGGGCPLGAEDSILRVRTAEGGAVEWLGASHLPGTAEDIDTLEVAVARPGGEEWVAIPLVRRSTAAQLWRVSSAGLVALALLTLPVFLLRHSSSPAAAPLLYFFAAVSTITVVAMSGASSEWMTRLAVVAMVAIPAILVHLNLTFLRGRRLVRDTPGFVFVPYALSSILLPAGWFALERDPLLWPAFVYLLIALTLTFAGILLVSSLFAVRESASPLERARARVLLYGALLVPVAPTLFLARGAPGFSGLLSTYLWVSAVTMPLPLGLAISRYNLFDLGDQLRRTVTRALYLGAAAALVTLAFHIAHHSIPGGGAVMLFGVAFVCMVGIEGIRRRLTGYLEARVSPRVVELRRVGQRFFQQVYELRDAPAVAALLGETLQAGLRSRSLCVFLTSGPAWRPAHASGDVPPAQLSLAEDAWEVLRGSGWVQLIAGENAGDAVAGRLEAAGVELVVALARDGETLGLVLVSRSRSGSPYTGLEIRFATALAEQASLALHNAHLAEDLVHAELHAGTARLAVTLVHQLGKELDWIRGLAKHLPERLAEPERARRSAERIRSLTDDVARRARGFLEDATDGVRRRPGTRSLHAMIDRAVQLVSQRFASAQVTQTLAPGLEWAQVDESVESVLLNLLDNALRASPAGSPVHVSGTREGGWLEVSVADRGCGMAPGVLARCFAFGFSTRRDGQGHGLGLAVSKETVEGLGGTLSLESAPGQGTRATLRLPLAGG